MHYAAYDYVSRFKTNAAISVIEIGSRNINGTIRPLFPHAQWVGLDLLPGPDVDVVIDARAYIPGTTVDLVICCEVFEHTGFWRDIINVSTSWLRPGGRLIATCAGPGRPVHSGVDGGDALHEGEWYRNLSPSELIDAIHHAGFRYLDVASNAHAKDLYVTGVSG